MTAELINVDCLSCAITEHPFCLLANVRCLHSRVYTQVMSEAIKLKDSRFHVVDKPVNGQ
jgi:hypothetical protein